MMSVDVANLMEQVHDYFLTLFHQSSGTASANTFLAFDPTGLPITPGMVKLHEGDAAYSPARSTETFSALVDAVPALNGDVFTGTANTASDFYELMVLGAQAAEDSGPGGLLDTLKHQALQKLDTTKLQSVLGMFKFLPAYPIPSDWYDPSIDGNWTAYHFSSTATAIPAGAGLPPPVVPFKPLEYPWMWRRLAGEAAEPAVLIPLDTPMAAGPGVLITRSAVADLPIAEIVRGAGAEAAVLPAATRAQIAAAVGGRPGRDSDKFKSALADVLTHRAHYLADSVSTPVQSDKLTLAFNYCMVRINRPWWSDAFLTLPNWFLPGVPAGYFSDGTATTSTDPFPAIIVGCVLVKDLQITTDTHEITEIGAASGAFGPFSLFGRTTDETAGTIHVAGMQIIGWICQLCPTLPPLSPPATHNTGGGALSVQSAGLNLREGPGITNPIIEELEAGTVVMLTGDEVDVDGSPWVKVQVGDTLGWVNKNFLG